METQERPKPFVVEPGTRPRPLDLVGEQITVLASGRATAGYEIFLQQGPEGSGPPPHSHDWDESFYVTKGAIEFGIGAEKVVGTPGTLVHLPAGTIHWFRFCNGGGEMLSMTSREGASNFFTAFAEEIGPGEPDAEKAVAVGKRNGVTFYPPKG